MSISDPFYAHTPQLAALFTSNRSQPVSVVRGTPTRVAKVMSPVSRTGSTRRWSHLFCLRAACIGAGSRERPQPEIEAKEICRELVIFARDVVGRSTAGHAATSPNPLVPGLWSVACTHVGPWSLELGCYQCR